MSKHSTSNLFHQVIYRTKVIQEFTNNHHPALYLLQYVVNQVQLLKFGLIQPSTYLQQFSSYFTHPQLYFIENGLSLEFSIFTLSVISLVILYWIYILCSKEKNYIQRIKNEQETTTIKCAILQCWKYFYIFLSDWLGFTVLEGCVSILNGNNYYSIAVSIIIIIEIFIIMAIQDLFLYQSLYFLPLRKNQFIKSTPYLFIQRLLYLIVILIYCSKVPNREFIVSFLIVLMSLLTLAIHVQMTIDSISIQLAQLSQSLILYVFLEKMIAELWGENELQFLWVLLITLTVRIFQMKSNEFVFISPIKHDASNSIFSMQRFLSQFYNLASKQNSQFKILSKVLIKQHQEQCLKPHCLCRNSDLQITKLESLILKTCRQSLQQSLKIQSVQSAHFYLSLIQVLIIQNRFFEALNISQKIISSLTPKQGLYKQRNAQLIREKISIKDKILLEILQQYILIEIRHNITRTNSIKYDSISRAIRQYQQQQDQNQQMINKFNDVIKLKIDLLSSICRSRGSLSSHKLYEQFSKAIQKIEGFKGQLLKKFNQMPTFHNQSMLLFLQIELLNDLINSYTINNMNTYLEEQDIYTSTNIMYQQISTEYSYVKLRIIDEEDIEIDKVQLKKSFQNTQNRFTDFYDLIPDSLKLTHKYYVRNFFTKGVNRFYLNIDASFIKIGEGVILPIDLCMDFQFDSQTNSLFSTIFMKKSPRAETIHYLLLDELFTVREISRTLYYQILGFSDKQPMAFLSKPITTIIPNFHQFQFGKQHSLGPCSLTFSQSNREFEDSYFGTVNVLVKYNGQKSRFYQVEIEHLKKQQRTNEVIRSFLEIEEKEVIDYPLDIYAEKTVNFIISDLPPQPLMNITSRIDSQRPLMQSKIFDNGIFSPHSVDSQNEDQEEESKNTKNEEVRIEDVGSQISSVAAIRRSAYYPQYQIINQLINSKVSPINFRKFNIFFVSYLLTIISNTLILAFLVQQLNLFQEKVALLSIKYDIYEPIESFLNTRYTIVGYNQALATNIITQQEFLKLVAFPRSNLVKGYDDLKDKVYDVLLKPEFQVFLEDQYFMSGWYESTKNSSERNITFRSGILALLNYQYSFKLAYTIYAIQVDGPYFYYSYKNYIPIYTIFEDLNIGVLNQLISSLTNQQQQLTNVTAPFQTIAGLLTIFYFIFLFRQRQLKNKMFNLLCNFNNQLAEFEIQRLNILQNKIQTHSQLIYRYKLDLIQFDQNLKQEEKEYQKIVSTKGLKASQQKVRFKLYSISQFLILIINFAIYCLLLYFSLSSLNAYIVKMQNTAVIYQKLSNTGVDVLIIHAQREVLYRRANIVFFTSQDVDDLLNQVDHSLQQINEINNLILKINQDQYLLDDTSFQLFQSVNTQSLCQYLPEEFKDQVTTLCPQVMDGVLKQGLIETLQYMYNKVYQEKEINNFTLRNNSQVPIKQLEAATFTAKVIKQLVDSLHVNLKNQTSLLRNNFTIIYSIFIVFTVIVSNGILIRFNQFERRELNQLRKIVYILPQSIQIFDDSYLRQIRNLIRMNGLV